MDSAISSNDHVQKTSYISCFYVSMYVYSHAEFISNAYYTILKPLQLETITTGERASKKTCIQCVTQSFQAKTKAPCFWKQHIGKHRKSNISCKFLTPVTFLFTEPKVQKYVNFEMCM